MERLAGDEFPALEDIEESERYFSSLESALNGYTHASGSVFPPLDDLPTHIEVLKLVAGKMDHIPVAFWEDLYGKKSKGSRDIPYLPMQTVLDGADNQSMRRFRQSALWSEELLGRFLWSSSNNPDAYRDDAEQCKRILYTYRMIHDLEDKASVA